MEDAGSKLLVVGPGGNPAAEAAAAVPVVAVTVRPGGAAGAAPALEVALKAGSFEVARVGADAQLADPPRPEDVCLFLHTSGTTARPKGVPLSHANLAASIDNIVQVRAGGRAGG